MPEISPWARMGGTRQAIASCSADSSDTRAALAPAISPPVPSRTWPTLRRGSDGCARFVEVEDPPVQPAVLVQVAPGDLKAGRVLGAARLDRLEPGSSDPTFRCRPGSLIRRRIKQHGRPGGAVNLGREAGGGGGSQPPPR